MKTAIFIECDSIDELQSHLTAIKSQIGTKVRELKMQKQQLEPFPSTQIFEDNNCYGTHIVTIAIEEKIMS